MRPRDLPLVRGVIESGPDDRVFDGLLLVGPVLVLLVVMLGRTPITVGLGIAYVLAIPVYVLFKAFSQR